MKRIDDDRAVENDLSLAIISATIKTRREQLGLSKKEFADKMNVSTKRVKKWESGRYGFSVTEILDLERFLGSVG